MLGVVFLLLQGAKLTVNWKLTQGTVDQEGLAVAALLILGACRADYACCGAFKLLLVVDRLLADYFEELNSFGVDLPSMQDVTIILDESVEFVYTGRVKQP